MLNFVSKAENTPDGLEQGKVKIKNGSDFMLVLNMN